MGAATVLREKQRERERFLRFTSIAFLKHELVVQHSSVDALVVYPKARVCAYTLYV